jgi:hypothetical protein
MFPYSNTAYNSYDNPPTEDYSPYLHEDTVVVIAYPKDEDNEDYFVSWNNNVTEDEAIACCCSENNIDQDDHTYTVVPFSNVLRGLSNPLFIKPGDRQLYFDILATDHTPDVSDFIEKYKEYIHV